MFASDLSVFIRIRIEDTDIYSVAPDKGHWNHIAHKEKLYFQATDIEVITCGNVPDIDPGSESPVIPVNFIDFICRCTLIPATIDIMINWMN